MIALLLVYGGWQFLRALCTSFHPKTVPAIDKNTAAAPNLDDDLFNYPPSAKEPESGVTVSVYSHQPPNMPTPEETKIAPLNSFSIELELQRLRIEVGTLREQVEAQQKEIEALRPNRGNPAESRIEPIIPSAAQEPDTSPEYDEALALARRGIMADVIASRCGITRAEADLVSSLAARGQPQKATREMR
ncbi:MAG: DUF2802 domain-containing protein [Azoarcus sp.]|nr:DUF2802 domain-containing protein [Azoarcus sp.]